MAALPRDFGKRAVWWWAGAGRVLRLRWTIIVSRHLDRRRRLSECDLERVSWLSVMLLLLLLLLQRGWTRRGVWVGSRNGFGGGRLIDAWRT